MHLPCKRIFPGVGCGSGSIETLNLRNPTAGVLSESSLVIMGLDLMPLGSLKKLMLLYQILQGEIDASQKNKKKELMPDSYLYRLSNSNS
jgi:hypothetical protein